MKCWTPYALFAAFTLAVSWKILIGHTFQNVGVLERQRGLPEQRPAWFRADRPRTDREDSLYLLPQPLALYNEGLKRGEIRLWNPALFCGEPLYANPVIHPHYPPQLILHLLLPPRLAYDLFLVLHLFFSGCAMFWLARGLGRGPPAACVAGLVWMGFGYGAVWFSTMVLSGVSVFGPLAFLAAVRALERKDLRQAGLAALWTGLVLLGSHAQHALYFYLFLLVRCGVALRRAERPFAVRFGAVVALLPPGIGLVSILLRLDTILNGWRLAGGFGGLYRDGGETLAHALGIVLGKIWFPADGFQDGEFAAYVGLAGAALAAAGIRRERFWAVSAGVVLALVFLKPLAMAFESVPLLNLSYPTRLLPLAGFCLALLAASGWEALEKDAGRVPLVLTLVAGAFLLACLVGLPPFRPGGASLETAIGFALVAAAAWARRGGLAFAALCFELVPSFAAFNFPVSPKALDERSAALELVDPRWRVAGMAFDARDPYVASRGNNLLAQKGLESPFGYESVVPLPYLGFMTLAGNPPAGGGRHLPLRRVDSPLLPLTSLRYLVMQGEAPPPLRLVGERGGLRVWEDPRGLPRARLVGRVTVAKDETDAVRLMGGIDPAQEAVIERGVALDGAAEGQVEWVERSPDRLRLKVTAAQPAMLVLSESWYPGWGAEVDGNEAPVLRANLAFRAVPVPAGGHEVRLDFHPGPARAGLLGSILSLGFAGFLIFGTPLRRERRI